MSSLQERGQHILLGIIRQNSMKLPVVNSASSRKTMVLYGLNSDFCSNYFLLEIQPDHCFFVN